MISRANVEQTVGQERGEPSLSCPPCYLNTVKPAFGQPREDPRKVVVYNVSSNRWDILKEASAWSLVEHDQCMDKRPRFEETSHSQRIGHYNHGFLFYSFQFPLY